MTRHLSRAERHEMLAAHAGIVTAFVVGDEEARAEQIKSILREQVELAAGDTTAFRGRMGKQIEAGALVTYTVLRSLAKRLQLTDAETQEILAQAIAQIDIEQFPE